MHRLTCDEARRIAISVRASAASLLMLDGPTALGRFRHRNIRQWVMLGHFFVSYPETATKLS
jgi:hypothetical protein